MPQPDDLPPEDSPRPENSGPGEERDKAPKPKFARHRRDIHIALRHLTALPLPPPNEADEPRRLAETAWAFPIVGAFIGLIGGLAFWASARIGLGLGPATALAIVAQVILNGARAERGLARTADGLGTSKAPATGLGPNGILALLFVLGLRYLGVEELATSLVAVADEMEATVSYSAAVIVALMVSGACSQAAGIWHWYLMPSSAEAEPENEAAQVPHHAVPFSAVLLGTGFAILLGVLLLTIKVAVVVVALMALAGAFMRWSGGRPGARSSEELRGTTQQIGEVVVLLALSATAVTV